MLSAVSWQRVSHISAIRRTWLSVLPALSVTQQEHWGCTPQRRYSMQDPKSFGLVLGAFIISAATKEYRSTAGSSPMVRFVLGMILAIGSLVFLGCPLRMIIRMSAGDLNAWVALIGFVLGVGTGVFALKKGFSLGRAHLTNRVSGGVLPALMLGILILALATNLLKSSESGPGSITRDLVCGPGSIHAPILMSLAGGLIFGAVAQKARMCFAGSYQGYHSDEKF